MQTNDFQRAYEAFAAKRTAGVPGRLRLTAFLDWPFFEPRHRELGATSSSTGARPISATTHGDDLDAECRALVARARRGRASSSCASPTATRRPDVRSLAIARETLARHSGLADFAFAMQGLGSGAISLFGTIEQKREWLPKVAGGEAIAAFAMTEPECGSDAANIAMTARCATATTGCWSARRPTSPTAGSPIST